MYDILSQHERIALAFSGGKDSLVVAHLLRDAWDRITFYHVDAGDLLPEVAAIVRDVERVVPRFVRVNTSSRDFAKTVGLPSDIVPHTGTEMGVMVGGERRVVSRYECCSANIWMPLHQRLLDDGITLVIRGTKRCDLPKLPAMPGKTPFYELYYPLLDWSHERVFQYIEEHNLPRASWYDTASQSPECATCPAWLEEARADYLRERHPELFREYVGKLGAVAAVVAPVWRRFETEIQNAARAA